MGCHWHWTNKRSKYSIGRRSRELEGFRLKPVKTLVHLGVTIDEKESLGLHILKIRIIANIKGPSSNKRAALSEAIHNIVLYDASVW